MYSTFRLNEYPAMESGAHAEQPQPQPRSVSGLSLGATTCICANGTCDSNNVCQCNNGYFGSTCTQAFLYTPASGLNGATYSLTSATLTSGTVSVLEKGAATLATNARLYLIRNTNNPLYLNLTNANGDRFFLTPRPNSSNTYFIATPPPDTGLELQLVTRQSASDPSLFTLKDAFSELYFTRDWGSNYIQMQSLNQTYVENFALECMPYLNPNFSAYPSSSPYQTTPTGGNTSFVTVYTFTKDTFVTTLDLFFQSLINVSGVPSTADQFFNDHSFNVSIQDSNGSSIYLSADQNIGTGTTFYDNFISLTVAKDVKTGDTIVVNFTTPSWLQDSVVNYISCTFQNFTGAIIESSTSSIACPIAADSNTQCNSGMDSNNICDYMTGTCQCATGWSGDACENGTCPTNSAGDVCYGRGTCDSSTQFKCVCDNGYYGNTCENVYCPKAADGIQCGAFGVCDASTGLCTCIEGWSGPTCEIAPSCPTNPSTGEICSGYTDACDTATGKCNCYKDNTFAYGDACEFIHCPTGALTQDGTYIECSGQGTCNTTTGVCTCTDPGITNPSCYGKACPVGTNGKACSANGSCNAETGACVCQSGWTGDDCSTQTCPSTYGNICNGVGACLADNTCQCPDNYTGSACDVLKGSCPADSNGDTCGGMDANGKPKGTCNLNLGGCTCVVGYGGSDCECPSNDTLKVCSGHGKCYDGACTCDTGYTGKDCSRMACPIGGPESKVCSGNGFCDITTGTCSCTPPYGGTDCSTRTCPSVDPTMVCSGHGSCGGSPYYACTCDPGWSGPDCSIAECPKVNGIECNGHGNCNRTTGTCMCDSGFAVPDCQPISSSSSPMRTATDTGLQTPRMYVAIGMLVVVLVIIVSILLFRWIKKRSK